MPVMLGVLVGSLIGSRMFVNARVKELRLKFIIVIVIVIVGLGIEMIYIGLTKISNSKSRWAACCSETGPTRS
jgi:hypothetical protein